MNKTWLQKSIITLVSLLYLILNIALFYNILAFPDGYPETVDIYFAIFQNLLIPALLFIGLYKLLGLRLHRLKKASFSSVLVIIGFIILAQVDNSFSFPYYAHHLAIHSRGWQFDGFRALIELLSVAFFLIVTWVVSRFGGSNQPTTR